MAFFRNYSSGIDSDNVLHGNDNGIQRIHGSDGASSENDIDLNTEDQYPSEDLADTDRLHHGSADTDTLHHGSVDADTVGRSNPDFQSSGRKTASVGQWGSSFWKDCQPMLAQEGLESREDLRDTDYDHKNDAGFEDNFPEAGEGLGLEDDDEQNDDDEVLRGQADVPAEEMLSDEYYEQDVEEQSDFMPRRDLNRHSTSSSRLPSRPTSVKKNVTRSLKRSRYHEFDADEDFEDEDENEEDGDDPDDADFEPDFEEMGNGARTKQAKEWGSDDDDEDDEDDDLDISDENDVGYSSRRMVSRRGGHKSKAIKETRSLTVHNRRKRGQSFSEEEDSSAAKGSDGDSDDDFSHRTKRSHSVKRSVIRPINSAILNADYSEIRTSGRSVKKVSYVESDESEEIEGGKANKSRKEDVEDEDGDYIEKVLWHQPKGMAEDAFRKNKSSQPVNCSPILDSEPDWHDVEFFIKWKGQSYLHCQWKCYTDLQSLSGFKKVQNYIKRVTEERNLRKALSREEAEIHDVGKEMELDLLKQYSQVERIFADRVSKIGSDDLVPEYLVKWQGLSYAEATWERDVDIAFAQEVIDEYKAREAAATIQGKTVDFQRRNSKTSLRKLDEQPEWLKGGKLRDYQLEGLNFLVNSWRNDTNVILADEMGLGKTVQSVSMLGFLQNAQQIHGPFLVVVPLSTLSNWAKEFKKWLPDMNVIIYIGNRASREICQQYEFYSNDGGRKIKFNALLTTYELVVKDKLEFAKIKWNYLMVDEAHRLKNSGAALYTSLSELSTKNKLLITGTPLQNSVEELWSLLHFLDPEKFNSKNDFVEKYKNLSSFNEIELANLHKELRPHILRRVIKDVEKSLPPKIERILRVEMSPLQKQYYKWILERNFQNLNKGVRGNQVSLLNIVVELKKCCNHPFLFESADHGYGGDNNISDSSKVERMVFSSGKLVILDKLLVRLRETNHRVLIFSQMVRMLDILAEYLSLRGFQFQRLDGSTRADLRHQAMEHFNAPGSEDFCFLLSTRAGGLGINLATADTVIIFDSDWNPQNDLQAMSRAHRIGQQEVVNIYRFVTSKSVEEDILERAKKKMVLDHLVIQKLNKDGILEKKDPKKGGSMFDKNELSAILRFGVEELFKEEKIDEESKRKLESMDIDEILERAEKVESKAADGDEGNELLSAFKVANFCNAEDDGTFWSRWIQPEAVSQADEALAPRSAKRNKSYVEDEQAENPSKRKRRGPESQNGNMKRGSKSASFLGPPVIEGAVLCIREWSGGNLSKKDAGHFVRAVKKFGDQISMIVAEVGGPIEAAHSPAQIELFQSLIGGCKEVVDGGKLDAKGHLLDFFGVAVKAFELIDRVQGLQLLAKRIRRCQDPLKQFRLLTHVKSPNWAKGCPWSQVDDARLLLGIHYHGYGNWEMIRLDSRLGLTKKIAPANEAFEDFRPRATNLDQRATALLRKEIAAAGGKKSKFKVASKIPKKEEEKLMKLANDRAKEVEQKVISSQKRKDLQKYQKIEPRAKEEGEISDTEIARKYKEERWMEWCEEVMEDHWQTLKRLQKLQTTSVDLPKDKVLSKVRKYLQVLGSKIDQTVQEYEESHKQSRMIKRLWNYVSTFSNLTGEKLCQIYTKLKQEHAEAGVGTSCLNGSAPGPSGRETEPYHYSSLNGIPNTRSHWKSSVGPSQPFPKGQTSGKSEAWKRRRRSDVENVYESQLVFQQPVINKRTRLVDPNSAGILGCAPPDGSSFVRPNRTRQARFPPVQGRQSEFY
ncbi:CHD3-type chromatin-remodeling factor PICKLE [Acorus calamus]|uniref:CHD3-type chromatin-remodeling factor PICKLE n=1 Tax=Acorus calamus TaxID=4465 RepID=A0AAV9F0G8_ACOCL|nr:CHD3-type chromatin-remodeling factor PICKLE [Acorus calamus]